MRGLSFWRINVHDFMLTVTNDDLGNKTVVSFIRKSLIKQKSRTIYINDKRQLISLCMYYVHDTQITVLFFTRGSKILFFRLSLILNYPRTSLIESTLYCGMSCYFQINCRYLPTRPQEVKSQKIQQKILWLAAAPAGRIVSKPKFGVPSLSSSSVP